MGLLLFQLQVEGQAFLFWVEEEAHLPQHKDSVQERFLRLQEKASNPDSALDPAKKYMIYMLPHILIYKTPIV